MTRGVGETPRLRVWEAKAQGLAVRAQDVAWWSAWALLVALGSRGRPWACDTRHGVTRQSVGGLGEGGPVTALGNWLYLDWLENRPPGWTLPISLPCGFSLS